LIRRVKRRYLLLKIDSAESVEAEDVKDAVWTAVLKLYGEYGASQAGLFLIHFDKERKEAVFRCSHRVLPMVHAALASVTKIKEKTATVHVLRISGTLRALAKKRRIQKKSLI
jgi:ribonuclease P/MRP protein subunit POP5